MRTMNWKRQRLAMMTAVLVVVSAACGSDDKSSSTQSSASGTVSVASETTTAGADTTMAGTDTTMAAGMPMATAYPVEIEDCQGRMTTWDHAPGRVVTFDPAIVEMMLLLGLKDHIAGITQFQTEEQMWEPTKADMLTLKVINDGVNYPSKEDVVALSPDAVMSIYPSALISNQNLPTREQWTELGVQSYLTRTSCDKITSESMDLELLYTDIRNLGIIFDVQERAEAEISKMKARVTELQQKAQAANLPEYSIWTYSGEDDPYPADGNGSMNALIRMSGSKNAFGDKLDGYSEFSWEEIIARNPDVVWVMTSAGVGFVEEAKGIESKLEADPRLSGVTAVKNHAYVILSYNEGGVPTPRNIDALEKLIDGLIALQ